MKATGSSPAPERTRYAPSHPAIPVQPSVHTAEVYGTITTDLRMKGVVPPSSALHPTPPACG